MLLIRAADGLTKTLMILAAAWAFVLCFFILAEIIARAINMPLQGTKEIVAGFQKRITERSEWQKGR